MHHILIAVVVLAVVCILVFFFVKMHKKQNLLHDSYNNTPNVLRGLKNPKDFYLQFTDIEGSKKCDLQGQGYGAPAYVVILRHCDRRFKVENGCKIPSGCAGSGAEGTGAGSCETNDCNTTGIMRAWSVAKWLNCFAKSKSLPIAAIVGQNFVSGQSNRRPTTTASLILESMHYHGLNPCYVMIGKYDAPKIKDILFKSEFAGKIVVIVTDHGMINELHRGLVNKTSIGWPDNCFDAASVVDIKDSTITRYKMHTLSDNDPCANCGPNVDHYPDCTHNEYGNTNPGVSW